MCVACMMRCSQLLGCLCAHRTISGCHYPEVSIVVWLFSFIGLEKSLLKHSVRSAAITAPE